MRAPPRGRGTGAGSQTSATSNPKPSRGAGVARMPSSVARMPSSVAALPRAKPGRSQSLPVIQEDDDRKPAAKTKGKKEATNSKTAKKKKPGKKKKEDTEEKAPRKRETPEHKERLATCQRIKAGCHVLALVDDTHAARADYQYLIDVTGKMVYDDDSRDVPAAYEEMARSDAPWNNRDIMEYLKLDTVEGAEAFDDHVTMAGLTGWYTDPFGEHADPQIEAQRVAFEKRRLPEVQRVIGKPIEGQPLAVNCLNQVIAPYVLQQLKIKVAETLGTPVEECDSNIMLSWTSVRQLNSQLQSDSLLVRQVTISFFREFPNVVLLPRPDNIFESHNFLENLSTAADKARRMKVYPPLGNLLAYEDPHRSWQALEQAHIRKDPPGIINHRVYFTLPPRGFAAQQWNGYTWATLFGWLQTDLAQTQNGIHNSRANKTCWATHVLNHGLVVSVYRPPHPYRLGREKYHLYPEKQERSPYNKDPLEIRVTSITDPSTIITRSPAELFTAPGMEGPLMMKAEPFHEEWKSMEYHLHGMLETRGFMKWSQVEYHRKEMGVLKRIQFENKKLNRQLSEKPTGPNSGNRPSFFKYVTNRLFEAGVTIPRFLPLELDCYVVPRYGPQALVPTLTNWGMFPTRDIETVDRASCFLIKKGADAIVDYLIYHMGQSKTWPK